MGKSEYKKPSVKISVLSFLVAACKGNTCNGK